MSQKAFSLIVLVVLLVCGPQSISQTIESKIYWTDAGTDKIQCANLDGSNIQDLIPSSTRLGDPHGIALDVANGKIYWTDEGPDKIQCANLDGSNVQDLIHIRDVRSPTSIALDLDGGKMYWIQTLLFSSEIWRANLNGSNPQRILRTSLDSLNGIALDTAEGKMYWTQTGILASGKIRRANLNGSNVQTLVTGLGTPSGIVLDTTDGKMYWTDSNRHKIQCANLDGSNIQTLVKSGLDTPVDIALDIADSKMYWVERRGGKILRANLDGSNVQTLVSRLSRPFGIALSSATEGVPSNTTVKLSPMSMESPEIGEQLTLSLSIADGENVAGYQATVSYDTSALRYISSQNGDYLPTGAFFVPPVIAGNKVTLAATAFAAESNGDGTLATLTFEVVIVKASTLTLSDALLTDSAGGSSRPQVEATQITESSPLTNGIGIALPPDLISEVAFAPNSTYFIVIAKQTMLTNVAGANILYGSCLFTLHIPGDMQGFVFPIKTKEEQAHDAKVNLILKLGFNLIPLGGTFLDALDLFSKVNNLQNRDLKIELNSPAQYTEPSEAEFEFIVLLKHPENAKPDGIDITIEQQYRDLDKVTNRIDKVVKTKRWIFDDGWAAPTAQVTFFDYPPFQLLPAEVQQYLLLQFSEFGTTESGLMPKETALLANYPNPFNPETWIPYQLAKPADVSISIYAADGTLVRTLDVGHQSGDIYQSKNRAAYWDGRNALGEPVASGVYFYTLTAGEFSATRKMLIRK